MSTSPSKRFMPDVLQANKRRLKYLQVGQRLSDVLDREVLQPPVEFYGFRADQPLALGRVSKDVHNIRNRRRGVCVEKEEKSIQSTRSQYRRILRNRNVTRRQKTRKQAVPDAKEEVDIAIQHAIDGTISIRSSIGQVLHEARSSSIRGENIRDEFRRKLNPTKEKSRSLAYRYVKNTPIYYGSKVALVSGTSDRLLSFSASGTCHVSLDHDNEFDKSAIFTIRDIDDPKKSGPIRTGAPIWFQLEDDVLTVHETKDSLEAIIHDTHHFLGSSCYPESEMDLKASTQNILNEQSYQVRQWAVSKRASAHQATSIVHRPLSIPAQFPSSLRYGKLKGDALEYFREKNPLVLQQGKWHLEIIQGFSDTEREDLRNYDQIRLFQNQLVLFSETEPHIPALKPKHHFLNTRAYEAVTNWKVCLVKQAPLKSVKTHTAHNTILEKAQNNLSLSQKKEKRRQHITSRLHWKDKELERSTDEIRHVILEKTCNVRDYFETQFGGGSSQRIFGSELKFGSEIGSEKINGVQGRDSVVAE